MSRKNIKIKAMEASTGKDGRLQKTDKYPLVRSIDMLNSGDFLEIPLEDNKDKGIGR